jgi:hypothetical protein
MKRKTRGAAIVIGAQGEATLRVVRLLQPFFEDVLNVSEEDQAYGYLENDKVRLVVMMDVDACNANHDSLREIRHTFPSAKILGLLDAFHPEQEVALRTAGVVFLGSYERFARNSKTILTKVLDSAFF